MPRETENEFEVHPNGEARRLAEAPFLNEILDILEKGVVDAILISDPNNAAQQAHFQGQHAAYRSLRTKLKTLAEGKTKRPVKGSVAYFAAVFDDLIEEFGNYLNAAGDNMHWMAGAIIGAFLLGVIGALCGLVLIFAKIMLTVMIGIAPIMIALSLFDVTKDYFLRWLFSTVSYALYPLVIAGVFSTVVGMSQSLLAELGDPDGASTIGALVPFFMMMFLAGGMILATPLIVRGISGNFMMAAPPSMPGIGGFAKGLVGTKGSRARARFGTQSTGEIAGAGIRQASGAAVGAAQRMAERAKRLG